MFMDFHFLIPESLHTKFGQKWSSGFLGKASFNFHMYMPWGQSPEMTLTLNAHIPSITQVGVCIYQLSGQRLHKFLKNPLFSLFPMERPMLQNLTLPQNRSRSTRGGHHLNILWWAGVTNATYQVSWRIGPPVRETKIFEGFLPYMGVAAMLVMWPRCREQTFLPPSQGGST